MIEEQPWIIEWSVTINYLLIPQGNFYMTLDSSPSQTIYYSYLDEVSSSNTSNVSAATSSNPLLSAEAVGLLVLAGSLVLTAG